MNRMCERDRRYISKSAKETEDSLFIQNERVRRESMRENFSSVLEFFFNFSDFHKLLWKM